MKNLIIASLMFLFIAVGGVVGYLYFIAEPKRHPDQQATSREPEASKPVNKDEQVPLPDAAPSQSLPPEQKQKQELPPPDTESSTPQEQPVTETPKQDTPIAERKLDIVKPVLIHRVNPDYPEVARKARVEGTVILEAIINQSGDVENVKVLRGVHPMLDQAAVSAVRKWRYKPATSKIHTTVTVKFKLR